MPETADEEILVASRKCTLTVYVQRLMNDQLLLTAQFARAGLLGLVAFHQERGLVFARGSAVRDATATELMNSGG